MTRPTFNWKLPAAIEARLGTESYGAQRAIQEDGHLLLILHQPPAAQGNQREAAVFLRLPDGNWLHQGATNGASALKQLLERYRKDFDRLDTQQTIATGADDLFRILDHAIPLARAADNMKQALQAAREAVKTDRLLIDARDQAAELARGLELVVADTRLMLDYRLARNAEEQVRAALAVNRAQHKLNILAALTLPLMALTAIFGMNLESGLGNGPIALFWGILLTGFILGLFAKSWIQASAPDKDAPKEISRPRQPKR